MVGAVMQGLFLGARSRLFSGEKKSTYSSVSAPKQPWNFSKQDFVLYYVFFLNTTQKTVAYQKQDEK